MPYTLEFGSYYLRGPGDRIVTMTDQVAFAFDADTNTMLKHGSPESVMSWWHANRNKAPELFGSMQVMVLPRGTPVGEINRVLDTSGYIAVLREKIEAGTLELLPVEGPRNLAITPERVPPTGGTPG